MCGRTGRQAAAWALTLCSCRVARLPVSLRARTFCVQAALTRCLNNHTYAQARTDTLATHQSGPLCRCRLLRSSTLARIAGEVSVELRMAKIPHILPLIQGCSNTEYSPCTKLPANKKNGKNLDLRCGIWAQLPPNPSSRSHKYGLVCSSHLRRLLGRVAVRLLANIVF